jgi:hypothetical protein
MQSLKVWRKIVYTIAMIVAIHGWLYGVILVLAYTHYERKKYEDKTVRNVDKKTRTDAHLR